MEISREMRFSHLSKVLNSVVFARSAQLRKLLQWMGEGAIAQSPAPSEYEVGVHALGRGEHFDPQTDSVVRKETRRLRGKLQTYYQTEGQPDKIRIRFDGPYAVVFGWSGRAEASSAPSKECVLVLPPLSPAETLDLASLFYDELLAALAGLGNADLVSRTTARGHASQAGDVREIAVACGADFVVESALHPKGEDVLLILWIVDGATGRVQLPLRLDAPRNANELARQASLGVLDRLKNVRSRKETVTFDHVDADNLELQKLAVSAHT
jgi:TolB-like protein